MVHFLFHKEYIMQKIFPAKWPLWIFLHQSSQQSSCYLSLALVCSSLENCSLAAGNCAISCREKKTLSRPIRNFPLQAHWPVTCFEAYAYTSRFEPCDMRACSAELSEALHRMNGSINLYPVLIIVDKNSDRVGHSNLSLFYIPKSVPNL